VNDHDENSRADFLRHRLQYIEDWKTTVGHHFELASKSTDRQIAYGSLALKSAYVLNGGGLLALPAFAQIFKVNDVVTASLFDAGALFICGIVAAALSTLGSYLNFAHSRTRELAYAERTAGSLLNLYYPASDQDATEKREVNQTNVMGRIKQASKGIDII
jgi:hypothetical protein